MSKQWDEHKWHAARSMRGVVLFLACWLTGQVPATLLAESLTIRTLTAYTRPGYTDGQLKEASFSGGTALALDGSGNLYIAGGMTLRKVTPAGDVTTLAGLAYSQGSTDGFGGAARFKSIGGVAVDVNGNLYVTDTPNHTVRKITPAGMVTTVAGLAGVSGYMDGTGSVVRFNYPYGIVLDGLGNLYVGDYNNYVIRKITPDGVVSTLAGTPGVSGLVDGKGNAAKFGYMGSLAIESSGTLYVGEQYYDEKGPGVIRKISPAGDVTTLAGSLVKGSADGTNGAAQFKGMPGVAVDGTGVVYVADQANNTIRRITPAGVVTTYAGTAGLEGLSDGTGAVARFYSPRGIAVDGSGRLYVGGLECTIRQIDPGAVVTTLAGTRGSEMTKTPQGVAVDETGNLYIGDYSLATVFKISPDGTKTTLAGLDGARGYVDGTGSVARFYTPYGVVVDASGNVYVSEDYKHTIRKITPDGVVTTLAGSPGVSGSADGTGDAARFNAPRQLAVDSGNNIYVADYNNHTIRKITPAGVVTTVAGVAGASGTNDGSSSTARFYYPTGVAVDPGGNIYVADYFNHTIRVISPARVVSTLAGSPGLSGSVDGMGNSARFSYPMTLAVAGNGDILVSAGTQIRKVTPAGWVTTLAGRTGDNSYVDGTGDAARLNIANGMAVDRNGKVYLAVPGHNAIRTGEPALADVPIIDAATGSVGVARQLDTAPQTAASWTWRLIRRPAGSTAQLSNRTIRNPAFVPDVADLYVFQLCASNASGSIILPVSLQGTYGGPAPVVAGVTPNRGPVSGGTSVSLSGDNFSTNGTVAVYAGGNAASAVSVVDEHTITCVIPPHATTGTVNLAVYNPDALCGVLTNGFIYTIAVDPFSCSLHTGSGQLILDFMTLSAVAYQVQWTTNLLAAGSWQVYTNLPGAGTNEHIFLDLPETLSQAFFRVRAEP